jgi:membrane fusion protein, copper/silver efflux system
MRYARQMARPILGAALALVLTAALLSCTKAGPTGVRYQCPMHPTYVSDRPGDCPICGMRLVPIETKTAPTSVPAYVCPMHPQVTSDKPGRCPECGMNLVPAAQGPEAAAGLPESRPEIAPTQAGPSLARTPDPGSLTPGGGRRVLFYRNPMDPKVTSPVPTKDSMGMDYVPVYADEVTPKDSGVPGLAAVEATNRGLRLAGVQTVPARRECLARTIRTVGTVVADETRVHHIHTRVSGWVEKLYVNSTGQFVEHGQPILSLYSPELLASQEEFLRARDAAARFASSELPEVRKGAAELLASARRRLQLLDVPEGFIEELERTGRAQRDVTLLAHVSGYVTSKGIFEGQQVDPSMMDLFTITDLSRVWIQGDFYEYEARALRVGEDARLTLLYEPGVRRDARVAFVYPTLNPESRTLRVRFEVDNPRLELKPGMFANVELTADAREGIVIPDSAIIDTGERQVVFVRLGGARFEPRQVRLGVRGGGKAEVVSGVAVGEEVVVRANFLLDSESQLRSAIAGAGPAAPPAGGPK